MYDPDIVTIPAIDNIHFAEYLTMGTNANAPNIVSLRDAQRSRVQRGNSEQDSSLRSEQAPQSRILRRDRRAPVGRSQ